MPVVNIIDHRKNKYRWKKINAVAEPTWHDNRRSARGGVDDTANRADKSWDYEEKEACSLHEALTWAGHLQGDTTLFIYNEGDGLGDKGQR